MSCQVKGSIEGVSMGVEPVVPSSEAVSVDKLQSVGVEPTSVLVPVGGSSVNDMVKVESSTDYLLYVHKMVYCSGKPNFLGVRLPIYTKVNVNFFEQNAFGFKDDRLVDFIKYGFPVGNTRLPAPQGFTRNHSSARLFESEIDKFVKTGVEDYSIVGPLTGDEFECTPHFSPLGSVEKKDSSERRIIMDLSFPVGNSVNETIPDREYVGESSYVHYPSIDDLVKLVRNGRVNLIVIGLSLWV